MLRGGLIHRFGNVPWLSKCVHSGALDLNYFSVSRAHIKAKAETDLGEQTSIPAENELVIYNSRRNIDARPRKLNLLAKQVGFSNFSILFHSSWKDSFAQIRYLPLSDAIQQMEFSVKKAATSIKEVLIETQNKAKSDHGITNASDLWIAESYVGRGFIEKNMIRHGRGRYGRGRKAFTHYFVVVKEGLPKPKDQRRSYDNKTEFERYVEYKPRILDSHAWW